MKKNIIICIVLLVSGFTFTTNAQNQNPRGIYKLKGIYGKDGNYFDLPFDQYKICTDDLTLTLVVENEDENNMTFTIQEQDPVFNYTGSSHQKDFDKTPLIYDSSETGFKFKWWSQFSNHRIFPHNEWCIEEYVRSDKNSNGGLIFKMLQNDVDKSKSLNGCWTLVSISESINQLKERAKKHTNIDRELWGEQNYVIFNKEILILLFFESGKYSGQMKRIKHINENTLLTFKDDEPDINKIYRIGLDHIALEQLFDRSQHNELFKDSDGEYKILYPIWERMKDNETILNDIYIKPSIIKNNEKFIYIILAGYAFKHFVLIMRKG